MALVNYYLTDSEGDTDDEEDTPPVCFFAPTPVAAVPPVEPPAGPCRPLPPVRPLTGPPPVRFSAPTPVTAAAPPVEPPAGPRRPHWLPPVRPLAGPPVRFSAPTPVAAAVPPGPRRPPPVRFSAPTTVATAVPPVEPSIRVTLCGGIRYQHVRVQSRKQRRLIV